MTNQLQIVITAKDQASAVVNKVTSALGRVRQPIAGISSAVERLGETSRLTNLSGGIAALGRGLTGVTGLARETAGSLGVLGGSMGAVAGAGTVAGVAALVAEWGRVGVATSNAAGGIGIGAGRLRMLQRVTTLAGLSADSMTGSFNALGATLQDAAFGRNQDAAAMLNTLGIRMHRTAAGAVDAERAMGDLAEAIARQTNPQTQARIAQIFGVEALLPILRKGRKGWDDYLRQAEKYGAISEEAAKKSEQLGNALNRLQTAAGAVGDTLEGRLADSLTPAIDNAEQFISRNREAVATWAGLIGGIVAGRAVIGSGVALASRLGAGTAAVAGAGGILSRIGGALTGLGGSVLGTAGVAYMLMPEEKRKVTAREQTSEEKKAQDESGWPKWLPRVRINWDGAPKATPAESKPAASEPPKAGGVKPPDGVKPQEVPKDKSWWERLFSISRAEAAPAAPPPTAPAVPQDRKALADSRSAVATGQRQPIGIRNNNPLNLRSWGDTPREGGFAKFRTADEGLAAGAKNIVVQQDKHGINTIAGIISRWAPSSDGNNVPAYINQVVKETGYRPDQPLNLHDPKTVAPLLSAMIKHENGMQPYGRDQIERAATAAAQPSGGQQQPIQVEVRLTGNVPPGATASVQGQDGMFQPSRIDYSMPDFARP